MLKLKRAYEPAAVEDGFRVLVDRLWPRGVSKDRAALDLWLKNISPSPELRQWFGHKPERFAEFATRYKEELAHNPAVSELAKTIEAHDNITLVYAARDQQHNHAMVLRDFIEKL